MKNTSIRYATSINSFIVSLLAVASSKFLGIDLDIETQGALITTIGVIIDYIIKPKQDKPRSEPNSVIEAKSVSDTVKLKIDDQAPADSVEHVYHYEKLTHGRGDK